MAFWMRNTLDSPRHDFRGSNGGRDAAYSSKTRFLTIATPILGEEADFYAVLEINGGLSAIYGFQVGDALQHPRLV